MSNLINSFKNEINNIINNYSYNCADDVEEIINEYEINEGDIFTLDLTNRKFTGDGKIIIDFIFMNSINQLQNLRFQDFHFVRQFKEGFVIALVNLFQPGNSDFS